MHLSQPVPTHLLLDEKNRNLFPSSSSQCTFSQISRTCFHRKCKKQGPQNDCDSNNRGGGLLFAHFCVFLGLLVNLVLILIHCVQGAPLPVHRIYIYNFSRKIFQKNFFITKNQKFSAKKFRKFFLLVQKMAKNEQMALLPRRPPQKLRASIMMKKPLKSMLLRIFKIARCVSPLVKQHFSQLLPAPKNLRKYFPLISEKYFSIVQKFFMKHFHEEIFHENFFHEIFFENFSWKIFVTTFLRNIF